MAKYWFKQNLLLGLNQMDTIKRNTSKTDSVVLLQSLLIKAGYDIAADSAFGPMTETAVKDFKKKL
jgi:peptidoglycan hydrolase-like protein with peptidoglycan-binding domain